MNGTKIIDAALLILDVKAPNTLFIGADVRTEYLLFLNDCNPPTKEQEEALNKIGVWYVAKYESYGIDRDLLWDNRNE